MVELLAHGYARDPKLPGGFRVIFMRGTNSLREELALELPRHERLALRAPVAFARAEKRGLFAEFG